MVVKVISDVRGLPSVCASLVSSLDSMKMVSVGDPACCTLDLLKGSHTFGGGGIPD